MKGTIEKKYGGRVGRAVTAAVLAAVLFTGTCMSASAGQFITDPVAQRSRYQEDDGSFAEFKWVFSITEDGCMWGRRAMWLHRIAPRPVR